MTRRQKITAKKKQTPQSILCQNAPDQLRDILQMAMALGFSEKPNYAAMKSLLVKMSSPKLIKVEAGWMTNKCVRKAAGVYRKVEIETEVKPAPTTVLCATPSKPQKVGTGICTRKRRSQKREPGYPIEQTILPSESKAKDVVSTKRARKETPVTHVHPKITKNIIWDVSIENTRQQELPGKFDIF